MHEEQEYIYNTIKLNIDGLLHKSASKEEIVEAIRSTASGNKFYGKSVHAVLINHFVDRYPDDDDDIMILTKREKEILIRIAQGMSTLEIADNLSISPRTVDSRRSNLIQKFKLKNSAGLMKFAINYLNKTGTDPKSPNT
jgi:DNA-binding NarL/FixJ family response regulator